MDLNHRIFVLLVVVWSDRTRRANQVYYLGVLVHLGPVSSVETIVVSQVDIGPICQQKLDQLLEAMPSSIMQSSQASLVPDDGTSPMVHKQAGQLIIILLNSVVQRRLLPNIMIFLS